MNHLFHSNLYLKFCTKVNIDVSRKRYTLKLSFVFTGDDTNQGKIVFKCVSVVSYTSWKISILVCVCFGRRFSYYYISYKATILIKFSGDLDEYQQISFGSVMLP